MVDCTHNIAMRQIESDSPLISPSNLYDDDPIGVLSPQVASDHNILQSVEPNIPQIRFLVSCLRSGSTILMRIFTENSTCAVTRRLVHQINRKGDTPSIPNYHIFEEPHTYPIVVDVKATGKRFLVSVEDEADFDIFPDRTSSETVKAVHLFRDPTRIFDSWKALGWYEVNAFRRYVDKLQLMLERGYGSEVIIYERLVKNPEREVRKLCKIWDIPFEPCMLRFRKEFGDCIHKARRIRRHNRSRRVFEAEDVEGQFDTVKLHSEAVSTIQSHALLTPEEIDKIETSVGRQYLRSWGSKFTEIHNTLHSKHWFFLDLDDTLHECRHAAGAALSAVLDRIREEHGSDMEAMKKVYNSILTEKAAAAFTDGQASREDWNKRFELLVTALEVPYSDRYLEELVIVYKTALAMALRLKPGALSLLTALKKLGKKVAVVSEGPEDAQRWTLRQLGIYDQVDFLATTDRVRCSKTEGLLGMVMPGLDIHKENVVYIGDGWGRGISPAIEEGVYAIHYNEKANIDLDAAPVRINTLWKVLFLLDGSTNP